MVLRRTQGSRSASVASRQSASAPSIKPPTSRWDACLLGPVIARANAGSCPELGYGQVPPVPMAGSVPVFVLKVPLGMVVVVPCPGEMT